MSIVVRLHNSGGNIVGLPPSASSTLSDVCSFEVQGAEHDERVKKGYWDGRKRLYDKRHNWFPLGLWSRIKSTLDDMGIQYIVRDECVFPSVHVNISLSDKIEYRPYQEEAANHAIEAKRSVLRVATGGGKTVIAAMIIAKLKCPTIFLVHTRDLLYQAKEAFEQFLINDDGIGQIGDGVVDIRPVTVATIQSIARYLGIQYKKYEYDDADYKDNTDVTSHRAEIQQFLDSVGLIIWDEVHRIASDMAYSVSMAINMPYYRVGLSASPWRDDGADMAIEASMGGISYTISASDLIDMGYLVKPIIRRVRVPSSVPYYNDIRDYARIYNDEIVNNEYRNNIIVKYVKQFASIGMPTLVLVQHIKHGNILKRMISEQFHPIDFVSGRDLTVKRKQAIQEMREGKRIALIASTIADEGLDIKNLSAIILAGGGKSSTRALQRIGRVLRPFDGKTHAVVIDFDDEAKYLRKHSLRRKLIYETEPRFDILEL